MASAWERSKGKWEIRAYVGLDPVSGKRQYVTTTVAANSRRAALTAARQFEAKALTRRPGTTSMTFGEAPLKIVDLAHVGVDADRLVAQRDGRLPLSVMACAPGVRRPAER